MRTIVHLTTSTYFGGPERQMLGLAGALPSDYRTVFLLFPEGGQCRAFVEESRRQGFEAVALSHDSPRFFAVIRELAELLEQLGADVLCCHGYKANLLGRPAARRRGIPAVSVSRGWTGENFRVRLYEKLDRFALPWMDRVICVSEGQAARVRRTGVAPERVVVIRNAIRSDRFAAPQPRDRAALQRLFSEPRSLIVGAAGRLSPEKGFAVLVEAAAQVARHRPDVGFLLFGEGPLRDALQRDIDAAGLTGRFVLAGFRPDLDAVLPNLDLLVLPSFTEGLPNVVLEAFAAAVPVVATAVGGTPEVIEEGVCGHLVPAGDATALADRMLCVLGSEEREEMGARGRARVLGDFTFEAQAQQYMRFFEELCSPLAPCEREGEGSAACGLARSFPLTPDPSLPRGEGSNNVAASALVSWRNR
jgi:glycosyltransferase involved in cell wall biosynthesis